MRLPARPVSRTGEECPGRPVSPLSEHVVDLKISILERQGIFYQRKIRKNANEFASISLEKEIFLIYDLPRRTMARISSLFDHLMKPAIIFLYFNGVIFVLIFVVILIWIMFEMIYLLTHRKPLNKVQMQKLSHKRTKRYIKKQFKFSARNVYVDKQFKSTLKPNGRLYNMNHSLMLFPAYVATLLKGKKHEWVVLALADDTRVRFMWVNKGLDSQHVAFSCEFDELINICKTYHCHTVLCFHNHPNSNPYAQSLLLASEQDMVSAESCSRIMSVHGINWIDFVCERGNYIKYFSNFSPLFCPECAKIENIQRENGISVMRNYKLHRELRLLH